MFKTIYQVLSTLAIAHMAALVGLLAFLMLSGRLTPEKVEAMATAWRGETPGGESPVDESGPAEAEPSTPSDVGRPAAEQLAQARQGQEVWRQYAARELREIEDRRRLAELIRLDVLRRQEQLAKEREAFRAERDAALEQANLSGFTKELEALSMASTKKRKAVLMGKKDADALLLLMQMETRNVKQVIDACKTPDEIAWISRLLERMQTLDESRAGELEDQLPAQTEQTGRPR
jgi:hypothetical protein